MLAKTRLLIVPGGHGEYLGEIEWPDSHLPAFVAAMTDDFLD